MQKKLLTVAVASALAAPGLVLAQASVEVYGTINMGFQNVRYTTTASPIAGVGQIPAVNKWDVYNGASNYGLRGRENLGGGLTAWFQIENNAPFERSNNVATTPASRNSGVGFQGSWGNIFVGLWTTPWADLESLWSIGTVGVFGPTTSIIGRRETSGVAPNVNCVNNQSSGGAAALAGGITLPAAVAATATNVCDAVESGGGVGHPFWRRFSNAVFYQSPVWQGFQLKLAYMTNEGKSTAGGTVLFADGTPTTAAGTDRDASASSGSIQWSGMGGNLRLGLAIDRHDEFTSAGLADTGWKVVGGYNFGPVDVGLVYERMNYKLAAGSCKTAGYGVAGSVPVWGGAIKGSYSRAKDLAGPAVGCAGDNGAYEWNLGYEHRFSKRTSLGVGYARIKNDPAAIFTWTGLPPNQGGASNNPYAGSDPRLLFVNMTHRF